MKHAMNRRTHIIGAIALVLLLTTGAIYASNTSGVAVPESPRFNQGNAAKKGHTIAKYAETLDSGWVDQYSKSKMTLYDPL